MEINARIGYHIEYPKLINKLRDLWKKYKYLGFKRKDFLPILSDTNRIELRGFAYYRHVNPFGLSMAVNINREKSNYYTKYFNGDDWVDRFYKLVTERMEILKTNFAFLCQNKPMKTIKAWDNTIVHVIYAKGEHIYVEETTEHFVIKTNRNFTYFCQNVFHKNQKNDMDYFISDFLKLFEK